MNVQKAHGSVQTCAPEIANHTQEEKQCNPWQNKSYLKALKQKWEWMSKRDVDALSILFHDDSVFVLSGA